MTQRKPLHVLVGVMLATLLLSSCAVHGLSFKPDDRVELLLPTENAKVTLPLDVSWKVTADDFDARFIVFFDRSPMRPNQDLRSLVPERDPCRREPNCPDAEWLTRHRIYVVDGSSVRVDQLPDLRENNSGKDRHDVTVVLVDRDGRRKGEAAWTREFIVDRKD